MARTTHDLAIDPIHDEIVAPNPFAEAILFFRGGANGEEAPIRVIQGPKTLLNYPDNVALDAHRGEVFVVQSYSNSVLVFDRRGQGDVAPIRILRGPKTQLKSPSRVAVDPVHNLLVVTMGSAILIFDRTAEGNVPPKAVISGPKTGMVAGFRASRVTLYPEGQKIFVSVAGQRSREGIVGSYLAVWEYGDDGDVPPVVVLKGPKTNMGNPFGGVALIPEAKELVMLENLHPPGLFVFHLPEVFE